MNKPALRPTVTQNVRRFLTNQGVDVRPWSGLDETYSALSKATSAKVRSLRDGRATKRTLGPDAEAASAFRSIVASHFVHDMVR